MQRCCCLDSLTHIMVSTKLLVLAYKVHVYTQCHC